MVGALKWCVLVTLDAMAMDGTITVGPYSRVFCLKAKSPIWIKKESYDLSITTQSLNNTMARQLRSKFDNKATFESYAAVNPLLNHHTTMPVNLRTLYGFKHNKGWSGVKREIMKADLQKYVKEAVSGRRDKPCKSLTIIDGIIQVVAEGKALPVSTTINRCLTELAGTLSGEITNLNKEVMDAVEMETKQ
ncbi:hypothetical protein EC991_007979 [Linnemannia zychae]|nr:hypothetical protein EC991_007979 [Linnemannia zychae]